MYLKVLGGAGAGAAGITGAYFAIKGSKNPTTPTVGELSEGISQDPDNAKAVLIRRVEENKNNNKRMEENSQKFIEEYKLREKQAKDILQILKDNLEYEITSSSESTLKENLESHVSGAMENFCSVTESDKQNSLFQKYCSIQSN